MTNEHTKTAWAVSDLETIAQGVIYLERKHLINGVHKFSERILINKEDLHEYIK